MSRNDPAGDDDFMAGLASAPQRVWTDFLEKLLGQRFLALPDQP
ncbi:hypothetical protein [Micromonospora sp. ATCC 39149]|nr:hypothetical protein [Micromonospora sp. ATCC 39149]